MRFLFILPALILVLSFSSCSSVNPMNPGAIPANDTSQIETSQTLPVGVSDRFSDGSPAGGFGVMGLYSLHLNYENTSAELTPVRNGALTDVIEIVDITHFLTLAPCTNCARIRGVSLDPDGNLVVSIGVKHPFKVGDPYKPISGQNRADLHVFNVEGYVVSNGQAIDYPGIGESVSDVNLLSADGYSKYLGTALDSIYPTEATLHPYVLHFDNYSSGNFDPTNPMGFESVTTPPPGGNLVMPMGCDYDYQNYVFQFPNGSTDFIYAVGCSYGVSAANKNQRFTPEFRIPQHNKKAASEVRVNILSNSLKEGDNLSSATLQIEVLDISHGVPVGSNLNEMLSDSSVGSISVEIPGVTSTPIVNNSPAPAGGNGRDPINPLTYEISVTNSALAIEGTYSGLVKVLDTYSPGQNTLPSLNGKDGIKRVNIGLSPLTGLFNISEFATYAVFSIAVATDTGQEPPDAIISAPCPNETILIGGSLFFEGRLSTDDNPPLVGFAWDFNWDNDPANFNVDLTQDHLVIEFPITGIYTIGLRVEDSEGQFDYASTTVTAAVEFVPPRWQMETQVSNWTGVETSERDINPSHQVVADCDGLRHIIFSYRSSGSPSSGLYYVNTDGWTMGTPEYIDGTSDSPYQPTLRIDYDGVLHLAYVTDNQIRYCTRSNGAWSTPEVVVDGADIPGFKLQNPSMDINYLGDVMITFNKFNTGYVWYNAYTVNEGSGWSSVTDITECYLRIDDTRVESPSMDCNADPEGRFHLTYISWPNQTSINDYDLMHVIYQNGSWDAPYRFNDDPGQNTALAGSVSLDGDLFAVWQTNRFGSSDVMYQRYDALSQLWGESIRVSKNPDPSGFSYIPDIAVTATGGVMYVWEYFDGRFSHIYFKQFYETEDEATILGYPNREFITGSWNCTNPNLYLEPTGKVHCVFEDDRADPGNYWATDMYYDIFS